MIDTYEMILWANPKENSLDDQAEQLFNILMALYKIDYLKPKYQTVRRKKDAVEFDLTLENVKNLIARKKNKQFPDLGSIISFFTSLNDNESVGISITTGVSNLKFQNTLIINFNTDLKENKIVTYDELTDLFKIMVKIFNPFYGCITCKSNRNLFGGYFDNDNKKPYSIFDVNYWDMSIVNKLNPISKYSSQIYEFEEIDCGIFLRLQKELINVSNINHVEFQKKINDLIGLG